MGQAIQPFMDDIMEQIHVGLSIKAKNIFICREALQCISMLAKAVRSGAHFLM